MAQWLENEFLPYGFIVIITVSCSIFRVLIYIGGYLPPISLFGRLFTGRLIIPDYDKVFWAPLCTLFTGIFLPVILNRIGVPRYLCIEITIFAVLSLTLMLPPKLETWKLTGSHRIFKPRLTS